MISVTHGDEDPGSVPWVHSVLFVGGAQVEGSPQYPSLFGPWVLHGLDQQRRQEGHVTQAIPFWQSYCAVHAGCLAIVDDPTLRPLRDTTASGKHVISEVGVSQLLEGLGASYPNSILQKRLNRLGTLRL